MGLGFESQPDHENKNPNSFGVGIFSLSSKQGSDLLHLVDNGLESLRIVEGKVGQNLTVHLDAGGVQLVDELAVVHAILAYGGVDTDNPQAAELTLLVSSVAISVGLTLFVRVFRHSPDVLSRTELTFGLFQDFLSSGS